MLNICLKSKKKLNFTECICAFWVIERLQGMDILGGKNTESVKLFDFVKSGLFIDILVFIPY